MSRCSFALLALLLVATQLSPCVADESATDHSKFLPGLDELITQLAKPEPLGFPSHGGIQKISSSFSKSGGKESSSHYTSSSSRSGDGVEHVQSQTVTDEKEVGADGKEKSHRDAEACKDGLCKKAVSDCENGNCKESRDKVATKEAKSKPTTSLRGVADDMMDRHRMKFLPGGLDDNLFGKLGDLVGKLEPLDDDDDVFPSSERGVAGSLLSAIRDLVAKPEPLKLPSDGGIQKMKSGSFSSHRPDTIKSDKGKAKQDSSTPLLIAAENGHLEATPEAKPHGKSALPLFASLLKGLFGMDTGSPTFSAEVQFFP